MTRLKCSNWYYWIGIIPLWLAVCICGMLFTKSLLIRVVIGIICSYTIFWMIRKFLFLPRPEKEYRDLEPLDMKIPGNYCVALFTSQRMAKYSFLNRTVELLSPYKFEKDEPVRIAVNPLLLDREGEEYIKIAAVREIEKYRRNDSVKMVLGLAMPSLGICLIAEILTLYAFSGESQSLKSAVTYIGPPLFAAAIIGILFFWNGNLSRQDTALDKSLLKYFSKDALIHYIKRSEEMLNADDKKDRKIVQNHYVEERIKNIEKTSDSVMQQ